MKAFKKLFALLLATLMLMGMLVTTAVAAPNDITIENPAKGHTYFIYQIFKGTVSGGVVSDISWGTAIPGDKLDEFVTALKTDPLLGSKFSADKSVYINDAKQIGTVIKEWSHNEDSVQAFADLISDYATTSTTSVTASSTDPITFSLSESGYYLIEDTTVGNDSERITDYLLLLSGSSTRIKYSPSSFDMSVNYRVDGTFHDYVDLEIDAPAYIKLEASLPSLYEDYNQYYMGYKVTLPDGLNFVTNTDGTPFVAEAYVLHSSGATFSILNSNEYSVAFQAGSNNKTVFVDFGNIHDEATTPGGYDIKDDDKLVVKLVAQLSSDGVVFGNNTGNGNQITAEMLYTNNMNQRDFDHNNIIQNDTAKDHWTDFITYSELPDSANVYTYQLQFQKRDSSNQKPLADATFRLMRTVINEDNSETSYYANFAAPADLNADSSAKNVYKIINWEVTSDNPSDSTVLKSSAVNGNEGGFFTIQGLDSLSYSLVEIDPPAGYNKMTQPVGVSISAEFENAQVKTLYANVDSSRVDGTVGNGLISLAPIYNTPGASLPTTGGIGTTIFYIVGGVLVMGAAAAFVMKRRNEA